MVSENHIALTDYKEMAIIKMTIIEVKTYTFCTVSIY